jgi:uncharacterized repeat protein (TIGR03803 family)
MARLRDWCQCVAFGAIFLSGCGGLLPSPAGSVAVRGASAQHRASTESVLYSFGSDSAAPDFGMIADGAGALYGTTIFGGGGGTVFKLTPNHLGYSYSVVYSFPGGSGGSVPEGVVLESDGALYGVTFAGGTSGNGGLGWGTVFKLTPQGSGYSPTILYRFAGYPDAGQPNGPIVIDKTGSLYGSSQFGGATNNGAVFKITPSGSGYSESVIYSFPGGSGGQMPEAGVAMDQHGDIYGTTGYGGSSQGICGSLGGCGVVFKVSLTKSGSSEKIIHAFLGNPNDGDLPYGVPTVDERTGAIYGTTEYGGSYQRNALGTAFKLVPKGSGYTESILHSFTGGADGFLPEGALLVEHAGVYGTTSFGGGGCRGIGCGLVFEITPSHDGYAFHGVYHFMYPRHGAEPEQTNLLTDASGALFGTTRSGGSDTACSDGGPGGARGCGVVFKILTPKR